MEQENDWRHKNPPGAAVKLVFTYQCKIQSCLEFGFEYRDGMSRVSHILTDFSLQRLRMNQI